MLIDTVYGAKQSLCKTALLIEADNVYVKILCLPRLRISMSKYTAYLGLQPLLENIMLTEVNNLYIKICKNVKMHYL